MRLASLLLFCCLSGSGWGQDLGYTSTEMTPVGSATNSQFNLPKAWLLSNQELKLDFHQPTGTNEALQGLRLKGNTESDNGLLGRFYQRALLSSEDAALFAWPVDSMQGGGHFDPHLNQWLQQNNTGQITAIMQNSIAQSLIQEVMGDDRSTPFTRPIANSTADFQRRLQNGPEFSLGLRPDGVGARFGYNMFGLQLSSGVSTTSGGLEPVQLSMPFLKKDTRGEIGVNSRGEAWLYMMSRW